MTNHPSRNWRKRWPEEAGAYVRQWRETNNCTQAALAIKLGVSKRAIEEWEAGKNVPPPYLRMALLEFDSIVN